MTHCHTYYAYDMNESINPAVPPFLHESRSFVQSMRHTCVKDRPVYAVDLSLVRLAEDLLLPASEETSLHGLSLRRPKRCPRFCRLVEVTQSGPSQLRCLQPKARTSKAYVVRHVRNQGTKPLKEQTICRMNETDKKK